MVYDNGAAVVHAFGKEVEDRQAAENNQGKGALVMVRDIRPPAGFEDDAEYKGVNRQHYQRMGETPDQSENGAAIAGANASSQHLSEKLPVTPYEARGGKKVK